MTDMQTDLSQVRTAAANTANAYDAAIWRWFSTVYEEGRLRWCRSEAGWLVSVDHKHLATERDFYDAIRIARERSMASPAVRRKRRL
jgi:hypothetical protein